MVLCIAQSHILRLSTRGLTGKNCKGFGKHPTSCGLKSTAWGINVNWLIGVRNSPPVIEESD